MENFEKELTALINKYSMENGPDTPDWILAKYLINCLHTFTISVQQRDTWHGNSKSIDLEVRNGKGI